MEAGVKYFIASVCKNKRNKVYVTIKAKGLSQRFEERRRGRPALFKEKCCCLHIKSRSDLYSVLSYIRTGPTDANAFLPWSQANYPERVHIVKKIKNTFSKLLS